MPGAFGDIGFGELGAEDGVFAEAEHEAFE
jgi:hypothetical protein